MSDLTTDRSVLPGVKNDCTGQRKSGRELSGRTNPLSRQLALLIAHGLSVNPARRIILTVSITPSTPAVKRRWFGVPSAAQQSPTLSLCQARRRLTPQPTYGRLWSQHSYPFGNSAARSTAGPLSWKTVLQGIKGILRVTES